MAAQNEKKKGLIRRGFDCLNQFGLKHTLYVIRTGEYRRDADDVYTVAESQYRKNSNIRRDVVMSSASHSVYESWIMENETRSYADLKYTPLFSVVIPVYNVKDEHLAGCIESVRNQTYDNWELVLVDDHSTWESVRTVLRRYQNDSRIKVIFRKENGNISRATNDGIEAAGGEFIAFADCDDVIAPNALYEIAKKLNEHPEYDFIYSDEDKLSEDGRMRHDPFFKPDWSPNTFLSMMYTNHLAVYRTELVRKTGGLRPEFDGAQDYDFTLRFTELTDSSRIGHIAKVLYYWREREESAATGAEAKPYALIANERAKLEALARRGIAARTEFVEDMNQYRIVYDCGEYPLVSIIIPSKDNVRMLTQCIESVRKHTLYPNYEIILVDNGSSRDNRRMIDELAKRCDVRYYYEKMEFNFSRMCNIGADHADGEYLLFLNDDIEVAQDDWLSRLVGQAIQDNIGAVGAKLLYPGSARIQHDGVINRRNGPTHILQHQDDRNVHYYGRNRLDYDCFAVTGACLLVSAEHYRAVGKMDEELHVTYNDVDLCLKLLDQGLYNVIRNDVVLYHHESVSRGSDVMSDEKFNRLISEQDHMWRKHPDYKDGRDPFYSRHFGDDANDFTMHKWNMAENVTAVSDGQIIPSDKWKTSPTSKGLIETDGRGTKTYLSGALASAFRNTRMEYRIENVSFEENHILIYGYMYLMSRVPVPVYMERYLLLTADDGGQLLVKLNRQTRLDIKAEKGLKDSIVGFTVRIPDHLLDRYRTSYKVSLLMKSAGDVFSVCSPTNVVFPVKKQDYCTGVHFDPRFPAVFGHGMTLTKYDMDENGILYLRGTFEGENRNADLWNCYLVVREPEGLIYYQLWDDTGMDEVNAGGDKEQLYSKGGFAGRIRTRGEVQAVLYVDRVNNTHRLYPISYELLCRQLGGETAYWNRISEIELRRQREYMPDQGPLFSILVPLYNTPKRFLKEMIDSVRAQTYGNWQLCLADGSDREYTIAEDYCRQVSEEDSRIAYRRLQENGGISENTNECMKMASGDWVAFFDHDDLLAPNALYEAVKLLEGKPETELIYTDEDKVNEDGDIYSDPHFKPGFDLELLRTNNYISHFLIVRKDLADNVGGLRTDYNGAQDFDFILRCIEKTEKIVHIPEVLYHWRVHSQSTAGNQESKMYAFDAGQKAIEDHLARCGESGATVERTDYLGYYRVVYPVVKEAGVSILIRVKDHPRMLERCVAAICDKTTYPKYEILISDTGTKRGAMSSAYRRIKERYSEKHPVHIYKDANLEEKARGAYLVEMDPSCELLTGEWLERMLGNLERTSSLRNECGDLKENERFGETGPIAAVCAKVIDTDGRIVSCGLTDHQPGSPYMGGMQSGGIADGSIGTGLMPLLAGSQDPGYFARAIVQQTVKGTDRWCYMMRRKDKDMNDGSLSQSHSGEGRVVVCPDVVVRIS